MLSSFASRNLASSFSLASLRSISAIRDAIIVSPNVPLSSRNSLHTLSFSPKNDVAGKRNAMSMIPEGVKTMMKVMDKAPRHGSQVLFGCYRHFSSSSSSSPADADDDNLGIDPVDLISTRGDAAIEALRHSLSSLPTGRAHPGLLDAILVPLPGQGGGADGSKKGKKKEKSGANVATVDIRSVSRVVAPNPSMLHVQVFDPSMAKPVASAISDAGLGFNATVAEAGVGGKSALITVPVPRLTLDARSHLLRKVGQLAEDAKVSIRRARKDAMDIVKKRIEKEEGTDAAKKAEKKVQETVDAFGKAVTEVEDAFKNDPAMQAVDDETEEKGKKKGKKGKKGKKK